MKTMETLYDILKQYPDLYVQCHGETDAERHNEIRVESVEREQFYQVAGRELHLHHLVHVCEVVGCR